MNFPPIGDCGFVSDIGLLGMTGAALALPIPPSPRLCRSILGECHDACPFHDGQCYLGCEAEYQGCVHETSLGNNVHQDPPPVLKPRLLTPRVLPVPKPQLGAVKFHR